MKIHILKWRIERDHSVSLWMKDVFDQQHLLISSFVSFLNTAISKQQAGESQVKYNTGLTGWGAPKQPGTPPGSLQKRCAFFWRGKTTLAKKKKRQGARKGQLARNPINRIPPGFSYERELQGRIKTELDSAAWGMKQHSWNELRQNLQLFLRVRGFKSALKRAVCITGFTISNCSKNKGPRRLFWGGMLNPWSTDVASVTKAAAIGLTGSKLSHPIKELKDYPGPRRLFPSADILF